MTVPIVPAGVSLKLESQKLGINASDSLHRWGKHTLKIVQEGAPGLGRRLAVVQHVFAHAALSDADTKFAQLAVDAGCTPTGVLPSRGKSVVVRVGRAAPSNSRAGEAGR